MRAEGWILTIVIVLLLVMGFELHAIRAVLITDRSDSTQYANARWREIDGVARTISTYRAIGENEDDFVAKHERAVKAMIRALEETPQTERTEQR